MARKLVANVEVDGTWYGPAHPDNEVTDDVADKITNPSAWDDEDGDEVDVTELPAATIGEFAGHPSKPAGVAHPGADASVREINEWVGDDPERARVALDAEQGRGGDARSSLVSRLQSIAGTE